MLLNKTQVTAKTLVNGPSEFLCLKQKFYNFLIKNVFQNVQYQKTKLETSSFLITKLVDLINQLVSLITLPIHQLYDL